MKVSNPFIRRVVLLAVGISAICLTKVVAQTETPQKPEITERLFASPDEAVSALRAAVEANDKAAMNEIFGPQFHELLTGDQVEDANNHKAFAAALAEACNPVKEGEGRIVLEVGTNEWPMPIPLVQTGTQWYFDTAAGKEEVLARHIGKDELSAIGVCRVYVTAQQQYASMNGGTYAQKFKSSEGKKDGLYWKTGDNEAPSPFGPLVAEAHAEGYGGHHGTAPHPFHGYYFRILKRQGRDAAGGKMNYIAHGDMTKGFALVAYPERWDSSGIMTFIVNQDGKVFERNYAEKTSRIGEKMAEYNPDGGWKPVEDEGLSNIVSEK